MSVGLRGALERTRRSFLGRVTEVFQRSSIEAESWDELEEALITADVGVAVAAEVLDHLRQREHRGEVRDAAALREALREELLDIVEIGPELEPLLPEELVLVLVVGFNGAGKTTSVAKLGHYWRAAGRRVLLVAGDTFRAAGGEQLNLWADRVGLPCIVGQRGADAAALAFDGVTAARARGLDLALVDTAGRVHTKTNLMAELRKLRRVADRQEVATRSLLVLDASTGQNGVAQARGFREAVGLDGVVVTKLDGTAKGGVLFAIARELAAPIRFVGTGEQVNDLAEFDPAAFVAGLLGEGE